MNKRTQTVLLAIFLSVFMFFGIGPFYEGFSVIDKAKISSLRSSKSSGLEQLHKILRSSRSLSAKMMAISVIVDIRDESSIPVLIYEFSYKGRWWVRFWDYEEDYAVDAYRSFVSQELKKYGKKIIIPLKELMGQDDELLRFWAVTSLAGVYNNKEFFEDVAVNDKGSSVRSQALHILQHRFSE